MSAIGYNSLLFKTIQSLNESNAGEQLRFMCRDKVAQRDEQSIKELFQELERNGFLSLDKLEVLKDLLKGLEEWSLFGNVISFERKRKEYNSLLKRIIHVFDELDCLEQLVAICCDRIPEEQHGSIEDVKSLFKELEDKDFLRIDRLELLKIILTQKQQTDLLREVEEFEERINQEDEFEWRKAQATAIASSVSSNLAGVLNIKTVFKVAAGSAIIASAYQLLRRWCTYDQLVAAVSTCVLPAGVTLKQIAEGCVILKVQAENVSALDTLWSLYRDGRLKESLQALLVTDKMEAELAGGEHLEVTVTIEEQEYEKAWGELLLIEAEEDESLDGRKAKRLKLDEDQEQKSSYIQEWHAKQSFYIPDSDKNTTISETCDSGIGSSLYPPSELGIEDTSDFPSKLYLKDLNKEVTTELAWRLQADPVALERFCKSFGLDSQVKLSMTAFLKIFPDTSVKSLKDVLKTLKLYDLVEILEEATKPRALRPRLSLKEIENLTADVSNRPTKFYNRAEVLIINFFESDPKEGAEKIGSFFEDLSSKNKVTALTADTSGKLFEDLEKLKEITYKKDNEIRQAGQIEKSLQDKLEKMAAHSESYEEEQMMQRRLKQLAERREQLTKEIIHIKEVEMKQKEEELNRENEKFKLAVTDVVDKWIEQSHDDKNSTLFVVFYLFNGISKAWSREGRNSMRIIGVSLTEKLELIHDTKLLITGFFSRVNKIPRETLQVCNLNPSGVPTMMLEILKKRWQTLDLISMMQELHRTCIDKIPYEKSQSAKKSEGFRKSIIIEENLSCLPRLQRDDGTNVKE